MEAAEVEELILKKSVELYQEYPEILGYLSNIVGSAG